MTPQAEDPRSRADVSIPVDGVRLSGAAASAKAQP